MPPIKLFKVRHYVTRSHPISTSDIYAALELGRKRELASVVLDMRPLDCRDGRHITDYFNYLLVSASRRTIDNDHDNDGAWEAYNVMYKGMKALSLSFFLSLNRGGV